MIYCDRMQKIYCYVDETGQDTKGVFFLVSVVLIDHDREVLQKFLEKIEKESGKRAGKWHKTSYARKIAYIEKVFADPIMQGILFFSKYQSNAYVDLTILTVAKAILYKSEKEYKATIIVDGLKNAEIKKFAAGLRKLRIRMRKVRGARDESDPIIRLADAIAGFLRDYRDGAGYAQSLYKQAQKQKIIRSL